MNECVNSRNPFKDEVEKTYERLVMQEHQAGKRSMLFPKDEKDATWWDGYLSCAGDVLDRLQAAFVRDHFREAAKMVGQDEEETNGE